MAPLARMGDIWELLRPRQWVKNVFVLAALVFSLRLLDVSSFARAWLAVGLFCLASSAAYALNDIIDADRDRAHPQKCRRPVASGRISKAQAGVVSVLLALSAFGGAVCMGTEVAACVGSFLALQLAYSLVLKNIAWVDVCAIAAGFVLRTSAGVVVVGAHMSKWLFIATFALALFLGLAKRQHELAVLGTNHLEHRGALGQYSQMPLDTVLIVLAMGIIGFYVQYSIATDVALRLGTDHLYLTVPFVVIGIFRYLLLARRRDLVGSPTGALLTDRPLQASVVAWAATVLILLYI